MEGHLVGQWTTFLEREYAGTAREFGVVDLDLAGVSYVDAGGIVALKKLKYAQVPIRNCPALIRELLEGGGTT